MDLFYDLKTNNQKDIMNIQHIQQNKHVDKYVAIVYFNNQQNKTKQKNQSKTTLIRNQQGLHRFAWHTSNHKHHTPQI